MKNNLQEKIIKILKEKVINLNSKDFLNIYDFWENHPTKNHTEFAKKNCVYEKSLIRDTQNIPNESSHLGIDFPRWYGNINSKKKIMILGIDPLRSQGYFEELGADLKNSVIIGTPYGLDNIDIGQNIKTSNAFINFITKLSDVNFVYVTDIYKSFYYIKTADNKQKRSYNLYMKDKDLNTKAKEVFFKEIELINPDIIITMGEIPFKVLTKKNVALTKNFTENINYLNFNNSSIPIIPLVHLSAYGNIKPFLKANGVTENVNTTKGYGIKYSEIINNYLNNVL